MLKPDDIDQVRSYAVAVAGDDRFQQPNVQWTYVLVGNSTSTGVNDQRAPAAASQRQPSLIP